MSKAISYDLRLRAIDLINVKKISITQVARTLNLSRSSLYRWLDNPSLKEKPRKGKPASFTRSAELKTMLLKNSSLTGIQLAEHFNVSSDVIYYHLKKLGFTYKKKSYSYKEACLQKKKDFLDNISQHTESTIYYLDESGFDPRNEQTRAWGLSSERLEGLKTGKRSLERISVIAAYQDAKLIAPMTYEVTLNSELFLTYLKNCLFPALPQGTCMIMDNAAPHKNTQVLKIAEEFGCKILYLPPYSPDLNPIEHCWGWIKSKLYKLMQQSNQSFKELIAQSIAYYSRNLNYAPS